MQTPGIIVWWAGGGELCNDIFKKQPKQNWAEQLRSAGIFRFDRVHGTECVLCSFASLSLLLLAYECVCVCARVCAFSKKPQSRNRSKWKREFCKMIILFILFCVEVGSHTTPLNRTHKANVTINEQFCCWPQSSLHWSLTGFFF